MPEQPERPIEKLLRAIAKSRREDPNASFELRPTTRRMLHGEMVRKFPAQAVKARTWTQFLLHGWPKLTWGVAVSITLVLGVWLLLPQAAHKKPETLLARNGIQTSAAAPSQGLTSPTPPRLKPVQSEPQEQALPAANEPSIAGNSSPRPALADPNIAAASPPLSSGDAAAVVQNRSPATRDDQRLALITEGIASAQSKTATSSKPEVLGEELKASESAAAPAITTALAASAIDAGMAEKPSNSSSTSDLTVLTQHFDLLPSVSQQRSLAAANLRTKSARDAIGAAPPVLASFSLEQSGRQLRVIDQDGSVYVGNLQSGLGGGMAVSSQVSTPRAEPVAVGLLPAAVPSTGQTYLFRVDGTNLSLNQRVVFWGKLVDSTNTTSTDQHAVGAQLQQSYQLKSAATQLPQSPAVNRRLSGTAIVGSAAEIAVEAVSTSLQKR